MSQKQSSLFDPVFMDHADYDRIAALVYKSYPKACILMIDRVVNPALAERFVAARAADPDAQEVIAYHGTKGANIALIAAGGFRADLNRTSAYGLGTYFARDFGYSRNYSDTDADDVSSMYVCRILVGKKVRAPAGRPIPDGYDTGVDTPTNPSIYVVPNDNRAVPEFLVRFHKNAA